MIVRRLDPLDRREQPQRRVQSQAGWRRRSPPWNPRSRNPAPKRLGVRRAIGSNRACRPGSVQFAAAERPPVGEQAFHDLQTHPANRFSGSSSIDQLLKVALQVGPADLTQFQRQLAVDRPAIATDDAVDRLAQQGLKALEVSSQVNHEEGHRRGRRRPEPAFLPLLAPAGLVGVLHRGVTDRRLGLLVRRGQGGTRLRFERDDGAQGDRHLEDGLDDLFHAASADVMTAAEVRHHRGQARPDDMGADLRGDRGTIEVATAGAGARVPLVLGDDGRQLGEFGDLMPGRLGVARPRLGGQRSLAVGADRGHIRHDDLDPLWREAMAMMSGMPRLAARFPPRGCLDDRLGRPRRIGRRGRGAIGGIASELARGVLGPGLPRRRSVEGPPPSPCGVWHTRDRGSGG